MHGFGRFILDGDLYRNRHRFSAPKRFGSRRTARLSPYKADWYGRTVIAIDKFYPGSKRCFDCGHVLKHLSLSVRYWTCPECGASHDRDVNAAMNILAAGLAVSACGEAVRPGRAKARHGTIRSSRKPRERSLEPPSFN